MATVATGTTDATGLAVLSPVPVGTVTITAQPPLGFSAPAPQTVQVTAGQTAKVTLQVQAPQATIDVSVVDQFGHPVAGTVVTASE